MVYKIISIKNLEEIKDKLPGDAYEKIYDIISVLDREYGEHRTVENDGGLVIYADTEEELEEAVKNLHFSRKTPELIDAFGGYVNKLYLRDNETGFNFIAPKKSKSKNKWGIKY